MGYYLIVKDNAYQLIDVGESHLRRLGGDELCNIPRLSNFLKAAAVKKPPI